MQGMRGDYWSRLISGVELYKGGQADDLDKQFQLAEDRADEGERAADELRLNLKLRAWGGEGVCTDAGLREALREGVINIKSGMGGGGGVPGALSWCDNSGLWAEIQERIFFCVKYPPWVCCLCFTGGGL